ncbi:hypothetical protein C9439_02355 [archaeon SCG-AAA382B04]|nr:hypothetical protein C9439_02355 [archaeon SCG-AAA382B04]
MSKILFKKEIKKILFSKKFSLYLLLIYLPLVISILVSYKAYNDPSILETLTGFLPTPLKDMNPKVAMMIHLNLSMISIALVAMLEGSEFISEERESKTLLFLVSRPIKRYKILMSKYMAFILIFLPLLFVSTILMSLSVYYIGIGLISYEIFFAYLIAFLLFGIIYINIVTLIGSFANKSTTASLLSLISLFGWIILDFLTIYLPIGLKDVVEEFSLSYHINTIVGYLSDGEAALLATGVNKINPSVDSLIYTTTVLVLVLTILPLILSNYIFIRSDVKTN